MTRKHISSSKNPMVQRFRDAAAGRVDGIMLAEGVRIVADALAEGVEVVEVAVSPKFQDSDMRRQLEGSAQTFLDCPDDLLARISQLDTSPGIAVLLRRPQWRDEDLLGRGIAPLVVIAAGVRDPGNLGSLVRTADAAGASGLLTMRGGADPFRDKAVRGSMGSVFRLPVRHGAAVDDVIGLARKHRLQLVVAEGGGELVHTRADLCKPTALVIGAEASGVPDELIRAADVRVRIPLHEGVESLNVAVASGVLLFEAQRQRQR